MNLTNFNQLNSFLWFMGLMKFMGHKDQPCNVQSIEFFNFWLECKLVPPF